MKVTMISDILNHGDHKWLSNFFYRHLLRAIGGELVRTGWHPATVLGAFHIHLLSSHPWERLASVHSQQPLAPAGFQRQGGTPQPDSGNLSMLILASRGPKQVFLWEDKLVLTAFTLGKASASGCCEHLIPRKKNDLPLQKSI